MQLRNHSGLPFTILRSLFSIWLFVGAQVCSQTCPSVVKFSSAKTQREVEWVCQWLTCLIVEANFNKKLSCRSRISGHYTIQGQWSSPTLYQSLVPILAFDRWYLSIIHLFVWPQNLAWRNWNTAASYDVKHVSMCWTVQAWITSVTDRQTAIAHSTNIVRCMITASSTVNYLMRKWTWQSTCWWTLKSVESTLELPVVGNVDWQLSASTVNHVNYTRCNC